MEYPSNSLRMLKPSSDWLRGSSPHILDIFKRDLDPEKYLILFGKHFLDGGNETDYIQGSLFTPPNISRIRYLALGDTPRPLWGIPSWRLIPFNSLSTFRHKLTKDRCRWQDLPEYIQSYVNYAINTHLSVASGVSHHKETQDVNEDRG